MTRGPCAKQRVTATIVTPEGRIFVGENDCANPQETCPRGDMPTGVGYELCKSICRQGAHAEVAAIAAAGAKARGGELYIQGHTYACKPCIAACLAAGIVGIRFGAKPPEGE